MANDKIFALNATGERKAETFSGYLFLFLLALVIAFQASAVYNLASERYGTPGALAIASVIIGPILLILILPVERHLERQLADLLLEIPRVVGVGPVEKIDRAAQIRLPRIAVQRDRPP